MNRPAQYRESRGEMTHRAFTLIELLVVISIITILAGLIIPLSGVATTKMRIARVKAELNQYVTAIESYKLETGSYPPDNGELRRVAADPLRYKTNAGMNPLFYELGGAIFTNGAFMSLAKGERIATPVYTNAFNVQGIQNSARIRHDIPYKAFSFRPAQVAALKSPGVDILNVPVPGPYEIIGDKGKRINPWFYDASTTNRHNKNGFDLWAEIRTGKETNIIGNWKN